MSCRVVQSRKRCVARGLQRLVDVSPIAAAAADEKHFVSHVLAFFAASDGIVVENLGVRFLSGEPALRWSHERLCR